MVVELAPPFFFFFFFFVNGHTFAIDSLARGCAGQVGSQDDETRGGSRKIKDSRKGKKGG